MTFRPPVVQRLTRQNVNIATDLAPNLLTDTLAGQDNLPVGSESTALPGRRVNVPVSNFTHLQNTSNGLKLPRILALDYPNPTRRINSPQYHINPVETQLIGQDQFFSAAGMGPTYDWTNPVRRKDSTQYHINPAKTYLIGQDKFFDAAGMGPTYDWPNPIRRKDSTQYYINPAETQLIGQDKFFSAAGMGPTYDWTNPVRRKDSTQYHINSTGPQLIISSVQTYDYPNPTRIIISTQYFINPAETQLFGQDQIYGAAGQVPTYDWPNPIRRKDSTQYFINSTGTQFLVGPVQIYDYPNPIRRKDFTQYHINPTAIQLIGQDQFFDAAGQPPTYDYPNPVRRKDFTQYHLVTTPILGQDQFFGAAGQPPTYDWTNPVRRKDSTQYHINPAATQFIINLVQVYDTSNPVQRKSSLQYFINPAETQLFGQDQIYGEPGQVPDYDWPNPIRPKTRNEFGSVFSNLTKLPLAANTVWRPLVVQSVARKVTDYYIAINSQSNQRTSPIQFPSAATLFGVQATTSAGSLAFPAPFNNLDWPNPVLRKRFEIGQIDFMVLNQQDTFYDASGQVPNYDWPNPQRPRQRNEYGFTNVFINRFAGSSAPAILGVQGTLSAGSLAFPAPFNMLDWPNPVLRKRTEFGHIDFIVLDQLNSFYGEPGQVPDYDWPNPIRPKTRNEFGFVSSYANRFAGSASPTIFGVQATLSAGSLAFSSPFNNLDWPNPVLRKRIELGHINFTIINQVNSFYGAPGEVPNYDWPNPQRPKQREYGFINTFINRLNANTDVSITGAAVTVSAGTVFASLAITLNGAAITASVGTPVAADNIIVSGTSITTAAGTIVPTNLMTITGTQATASAGTTTISESIIITGAQVISAAGTVSFTGLVNIPVIGVEIMTAVGTTTIITTASPSISGVATTSNAGTVSDTIIPILFGTAVTASAGNIISAITITISGVGIIATAGSTTTTNQLNTNGVSVTANAGGMSITASANPMVSGVQATTSIGGLGFLGLLIGIDVFAYATALHTATSKDLIRTHKGITVKIPPIKNKIIQIKLPDDRTFIVRIH